MNSNWEELGDVYSALFSLAQDHLSKKPSENQVQDTQEESHLLTILYWSNLLTFRLYKAHEKNLSLAQIYEYEATNEDQTWFSIVTDIVP